MQWLPLAEAEEKGLIETGKEYRFEYREDGEVQDEGKMDKEALDKSHRTLDHLEVWVLVDYDWISVEDELPKTNKVVIVRCREYASEIYFYISAAYHDNLEGWYSEDGIFEHGREIVVTHWLPIPPID